MSGHQNVILTILKSLTIIILCDYFTVILKSVSDESSYHFDAFVSYKSCAPDEYFVVHHLHPRLEKHMGYKLCLHYRDFIGGAG